MPGLIPEIIAKLDIAHGIFPAADNFKIFIHMKIATRRFATRIAKKGNDNFAAQTMHRMRAGQICLGLNLVAINHLVQPRRTRVGGGINNMQII